MAARKKPKVQPKRTAKPAAPPGPDLAALREELEAQAASARASASAEVEEEGDDDERESDASRFVTYDSTTHGIYPLATHSAIPNDVYRSMTDGERKLKDFVLAQSTANAKHAEGMFTGFATNHHLQASSLQSAQQYAEKQRDRADQFQKDIIALERKIAEMVALSEETKTERMRLQRDIEHARAANERLEVELRAKHELRVAELAAVHRATAPLFEAAGIGLKGLILEYGPRLASLGGAPAGASPAKPAHPAQDTTLEVQVSIAGAEEWLEGLVRDLQDLKKESAACLRALACSYALADQGAPPVPTSLTKGVVFGFVMKDLGEQRALAFLQSLAQAYVAPEPPQEARAAGPPN